MAKKTQTIESMGYENYLSVAKNVDNRESLSKDLLRISCHMLQIQVVRFTNIPKDWVCIISNNIDYFMMKLIFFDNMW